MATRTATQGLSQRRISFLGAVRALENAAPALFISDRFSERQGGYAIEALNANCPGNEAKTTMS
jgi:hypothetical protein